MVDFERVTDAQQQCQRQTANAPKHFVDGVDDKQNVTQYTDKRKSAVGAEKRLFFFAFHS